MVTIGAITATNFIGPLQGYPNPGSCLFIVGRTSAAVWGFVLAFEIVMLFLNVFKRYQYYRETSNPLIATLFHDGVFYMSCIIFVTLGNIILTVTVPAGYTDAFDTLQIISHSVLASRILFNLRQIRSGEDMVLPVSQIVFKDRGEEDT